ncbi:hypothetical protein CO683_40485 [Bradyrhizobium ottawaense]|nr:hypothetical protein CO683_40485 [Bradyrhizobium ottawaense]QHP74420.1 hypothetical protein EI171_41280 [Bradyrhizobium sp. LCT2]
MRMQSVLYIKQISRPRVSPIAPLTWPFSAPSIHFRRTCRTGPLRRRPIMRGVWLRLFRVAHRSRHRRRHRAEDQPTVCDGNSQDREEK